MLWGLLGSSMMITCLSILAGWEDLKHTIPFWFLSGGVPTGQTMGEKLDGHGLGGPLIRIDAELSVNMIVVVPSEPATVSVQTNPSWLLSVAGTCESTADAWELVTKVKPVRHPISANTEGTTGTSTDTDSRLTTSNSIDLWFFVLTTSIFLWELRAVRS